MQQISDFIENQKQEVKYKKKENNLLTSLKNWREIAVNKDINGARLISGNQTCTAVGLGLIAED